MNDINIFLHDMISEKVMTDLNVLCLRMLIMLVTKLIASLHQAHVTFWDDLLSVGLQRSRAMYLSPLLDPNTLLLDLVVLRFSR